MSSEHSPCSVPSTIAGYNICERIGSGTFSNVYKGISIAPSVNGIRTTVAIKVLDMHAANSSKLSSDCVVSEIRILKSLKHRNIVRLYDFQWDRNNIYLIMEYCGGGDLGSFIKQHGSLPEAITCRFFRQLAQAIQYMRAMDVAHMDLKPQNILLTNRYRPFLKISDFGLSQYLHKDEHASCFRGSPLYMAPEIFLGGGYDSRVDLWSCGIILYECLYGIPPFCADSYDKLVEQILSKQSINFPMHIRLSYDCLDLLQALLVRDPSRRISFERFFAHPFVNLAKSSSKDELEKADAFVAKARQAEASSNLVEATKLLTSAIQIYISCLEMLEDGEKKARFREKIKTCLEHAECLKERLRPVVDDAPRSADDVSEWPDFPQVDAANVIAKVARSLELQERWDEAFNKYLLAIEGAMRVLSLENDRKSERGAKLRSQVSKWMSSAEKIKKYKEVMNDDLGISLDGGDEAEKQFLQLTSSKQCAVM